MRFGPVPPKNLPEQDPIKVLMLAERWQRASYAQEKWATPAKVAVDMFEGRQWTAEQIAAMGRGRAALKFNIIAPLVRIVQGYFGNNKNDITFSPGQDTLSTEKVAEALTHLEKAIATGCHQEFVDIEVFLDGLISGRGYFNTQLDWSDNDLGEVKTEAADPFSIYPDPDASTYDLNATASFMQQAKWLSLDEIEGNLGKNAMELVRPWTKGQTPMGPLQTVNVNDEISPQRFFGMREDGDNNYWDNFYSMMGDFVDTHRKSIRAIETQYKVREPRNVFIDLETGDKRVIPDSWSADDIQKCIVYAQSVDNPVIVQHRMVERIHWTTMVADLIIYDAPSFYEGYTHTLYAPYFRRGVTRGMTEDLVDPQKEKNKRRSNRAEITARTANGGTMYHQDALDPIEEARLKKYGSTPGFNLKWKGTIKPERIDPAAPPVGQERLEADADEDARRISGVNEAALGNEDARATSGRAIEARQRQSVVSVQPYLDNFRRTKILLGVSHLSIIQRYYTEQRIYRITGEDGKQSQITINQAIQDPASGGKRILNDVTLGKYSAVVDTAPASATFLAAQFDEMMSLLKEVVPIITNPLMAPLAPLVFQASSLDNKEQWVAALQQIAQTPPPMQPGAPGAPPGGGQPAPGPQQVRPQAPPPQGGNVVQMPVRA